MNITESNKAANAIGGKTARACDSCLIKRARWFCAADDAFLCQSCDSAVHSANQLASRHERVRLGTASLKGSSDANRFGSAPSWHQGFTRKARTPRPSKSAGLKPPASHQLPLVPEINAAGEDPFLDDINEEQLLYMVPVFDPFADEFCRDEIVKEESLERDDDHELNLADLLSNCDEELGDFAADVEGLLAVGDEEIGINVVDEFLEGKRSVKVEEDDGDEVEAVIACHFDPALDMDMELNLDFDYATTSCVSAGKDTTSCVSAGKDTKMLGAEKTTSDGVDGGSGASRVEKRMLLRLNYEAVIAAWASQGSPWTDGIRPQFNLDEFMVACLEGGRNPFGGRSGANDAGREARVSRYREKRRTRLFSKKIRYQVRKLNAEKRPRMKGRFVKRTTTFSGSSLPCLINN